MIALTHVRLIDGTGAPPLDDAVVVLDGVRIQAAGQQADYPSGAKVMDLHGHTLLPGLIDVHVHFGGFVIDDPEWRFTYWSIFPFFLDYARGFKKRRDSAIRSGVTTVRSAGDNHPQILQLRGRIDAGKLVGPRIVAAGPIFTAPGGHPAGTIYKRNPYVIEHATRQVDDAVAAREEVRRLASEGVDHIKAVYGDVNPFDLERPVPKLRRHVLQALVDEAHRQGVPAMVHVGTPEDAIEAVAAGADSIEHGILPGASSTECPPELVAAMRACATFFVPTLTAAWAMKRVYPDALKHAMRWVKQLHQAGVRVALGTDAGAPGVVIGKAVHMELELLVESGLTPSEAIIAGTRDAADSMRRLDDLGTIEPGKLADLIAVAGNPFTDISASREIRLVIKNGTIVVDRVVRQPAPSR